MKLKITAVHNRTGEKMTWKTTLRKLRNDIRQLTQPYGTYRILRVSRVEK